ncbi:MAG TPA: serine/threonine-protein kinase, partial [Kofleriaceae bacterium]
MGALQPQAIGRYELLLELGRGGMAVLHLARAQGVGGFTRLFAIKQILPHLAVDPPFVEMFLNEGRIAARLSHPNLCPVFELGQDRGELYLVMEYLDGVPWDALAAAAPRDARGLALTAGVLAQACEGLHYAHTFRDVDGTPLAIIHRDVSPQNLFVSADGVCRVLDFGVSKIASDRRRTDTGLLKGKLPYMAPEQLHGEVADPRADIWAVGVMLWEALTGERLFDRATDFLTYQAIIDAPIPAVATGGLRYPA